MVCLTDVLMGFMIHQYQACHLVFKKYFHVFDIYVSNICWIHLCYPFCNLLSVMVLGFSLGLEWKSERSDTVKVKNRMCRREIEEEWGEKLVRIEGEWQKNERKIWREM